MTSEDFYGDYATGFVLPKFSTSANAFMALINEMGKRGWSFTGIVSQDRNKSGCKFWRRDPKLKLDWNHQFVEFSAEGKDMMEAGCRAAVVALRAWKRETDIPPFDKVTWRDYCLSLYNKDKKLEDIWGLI